MKLPVQNPAGMPTNLWDAQSRDELIERTAAPLIHGLLDPGIGLLPKAGRGDNIVLMPLQFIEIAEISNPAVLHKGFQCAFCKPLYLHASLTAEMDELAHHPRSAVLILAIELSSPTGACADMQCAAAAGTCSREREATAFRVVFYDLRDDHIGFDHGDRVTGAQSQPLEVINVVQVGVVHGGPVDHHIIEDAGETDHAGSRGSHLQAAEHSDLRLVRPLERGQPVFMVPGGAQRTAIGQIVKLEDQAIHRIGILFGLILIHCILKSLFRNTSSQNRVAHRGKAHLCHVTKLLPFCLDTEMIADKVEGHEAQVPFPTLLRIQLSGTACGQIAGVGIWLVQCLVECVKVHPTDDSLTAHLQRILTGNGQRHILHDTDSMCYILALQAITTGNGLHQLALLVAQHKGQSIQLPAQDRHLSIEEFMDIRNILPLGCREHGPGVAHRCQAFQDLTGHTLCGGGG